MQDEIRFKGHISVILVMDIKPFVHPDDRQRFETIRGYRAFADVLKEEWPRLLQNTAFEPVDLDVLGVGRSPTMSTDEVGFVTGMFRLNMLDLYSAPVYRVKKEAVPFSKAITENLQYKKRFAPMWDNWNIYLRPTMTGMMVIRLERPYDRKFVPVLSAASNVIELQTPFDVPSAVDALKRLETKLQEPRLDPHERRETQQKRDDTREFLHWIGVENIESPELDYIPVQWQLANELSRHLISNVGQSIQIKGRRPIRFNEKKPDLSKSLYNVYTIYHVDELVVNPAMIKPPESHDAEAEGEAIPTAAANGGTSPSGVTTRTAETRSKSSVKGLQSVEVSDIKRSIRIKRGLAGLIEGSILSKKESSALPDRRFPKHSLRFIDKIFEQDKATWSDELCILGSRTAIIIPSSHARNEQLFVSKLDVKTASASVDYTRYWESLERLIEFVNEISILAQLVENDSAGTLQQFVNHLDAARRNILRRQLNGTLDESQHRLAELTNQSANLSRLVGLCQGLINPNSWSRAEYAVEKANHLLHEMQTPLLVNHAERNVSNLTNLVDHVDELVLAQLSENSNAQNSRQSLILAGLSLSIILFTLPSFWADIDQLNDNPVVQAIRNSDLLTALAVTGSVLAPFIFVGSIIIALMAGIPMVYRFGRKMQTRRSQEFLLEETILEESGSNEKRLRRRLWMMRRDQ